MRARIEDLDTSRTEEVPPLTIVHKEFPCEMTPKPIRLFRANAKSRKGVTRKLFADFVESQIRAYEQE